MKNLDMPHPTEEKLLRQLFYQLAEAWNAGDGPRYASYFTEDCTYITFQGEQLAGRQSIADAHADLFTGLLRGSRLSVTVESIRFLSPDIALLYSTGSVQLRWQRKTPANRLSVQTNVALREAGGWWIAAFHNGRIQRPGWLQQLLARLLR